MPPTDASPQIVPTQDLPDLPPSEPLAAKSVVIPASDAGSIQGLPKLIRFESLARCGDEIWIENEGQVYRLRKTRQGKLILTK